MIKPFILVLAAFAPISAYAQSAEIANPAATFCNDVGGTYVAEARPLCQINGQSYDAWELFRQNWDRVGLAAEDTSVMDFPAAPRGVGADIERKELLDEVEQPRLRVIDQ